MTNEEILKELLSSSRVRMSCVLYLKEIESALNNAREDERRIMRGGKQ